MTASVLAEMIAGLDDDAALAAVAALESSWRDKHSCEDAACWGMVAYPADFFRRILSAAMTAAGPDPVFLDAGAGIGAKVLIAARAGCRASGVEHNPHYVQAARTFGADVTLGDVTEMDYSAADIVWVNCPLREPEAQMALEARIASEMKPGAVLAMGNRAGPAPAGWKQLTGIIERDGAWLKPA
jgi:SAM-dependent methyltransferase